MRKVRVLLYYVPTTTNNKINWKHPRFPIMHCYKLVRLHIQRNFRARLCIRVSNWVQPVKYARKYLTNNPCHKLYHYIPACSTCHHALLHTPTILRTKNILFQTVTYAREYRTRQNCLILHYYTHTRFTCHHPILNTKTFLNQTDLI